MLYIFCSYRDGLKKSHRGQNRIPINYIPSQYLEGTKFKNDQEGDSIKKIISLRTSTDRPRRRHTYFPLSINIRGSNSNDGRVSTEKYVNGFMKRPTSSSTVRNVENQNPTSRTIESFLKGTSTSKSFRDSKPTFSSYKHSSYETTQLPFRHTFPSFFTIPPQFTIAPSNSIFLSNVWEKLTSPSDFYQSLFDSGSSGNSDFDLPSEVEQLTSQLRSEESPFDPVEAIGEAPVSELSISNEILSGNKLHPQADSDDEMMSRSSNLNETSVILNNTVPVIINLPPNTSTNILSSDELLNLKDKFLNTTDPNISDLLAEATTENEIDEGEKNLLLENQLNFQTANETSEPINGTDLSTLTNDHFSHIVTTPFSYLALKEKHKTTSANSIIPAFDGIGQPTESDVLTQEFVTSVLTLLGLSDTINSSEVQDALEIINEVDTNSNDLHFISGSTTPLSYLHLKEKYTTSSPVSISSANSIESVESVTETDHIIPQNSVELNENSTSEFVSSSTSIPVNISSTISRDKVTTSVLESTSVQHTTPEPSPVTTSIVATSSTYIPPTSIVSSTDNPSL